MSGIDRLFKPGQKAESRSFCPGYRGAWFCCKIRNIRRKDGLLMFETEYPDFPDEKVVWEKVYRHPPGVRKDPKLMFRPKYPALYKEGEVPDISSISEVAIIVNNTWKEGDLVDWFCQDCYWSGKITQVLGNDKLMVELFPPPDGEGSSYEALAKDLRPSLDWSPYCGWTLPKPVGKGRSSCAHLVKPNNQGKKAAGPEVNYTFENVDKGTNSISSSGLSDTSSSDSLSSDILEKISKRYTVEEPREADKAQNPTQSAIKEDENTVKEPLEIDKDQNSTQSAIKEDENTVKEPLEVDKAQNPTQSAIKKDEQNASTEGTENQGEQNGLPDNPSKKMRTDRSISRNTMSSGAIEAAILDLEELRNRVKWIKDILQFGIPSPNSKHRSWTFVEHKAPSLPR